MKGIITSIILCFCCIQMQAQDDGDKKENDATEFSIDSTSVLTIDSTIKTLYRVISGKKGEKRNWKQFRYLFKPDAKLIPSGKNNEGEFMLLYMKPQDYIKSSGKWLEENGFIEKEIKRKKDIFGNMAHVFSTYEAYRDGTEDTPFMRGINSIQLVNDGGRWWIVNIFWTQETKSNPIPNKYLPKANKN